jgi:shikimate kinase
MQEWIRHTILYICNQSIEVRMIVFLIGFMGSGKSFYAKGLSEYLHVPFVDLDQFIEEEQAISISEIFEKMGESAFRTIESIAIKQVYKDLVDRTTETQQKNDILGVISCGGGTPCFNGNMDWMNEHGLTVWINPAEEIIWERLIKEPKTRPLVASLTEDALKEFIHQKLLERKPYYEKAQSVINQPDVTISEFVNIIQNAKNLF